MGIFEKILRRNTNNNGPGIVNSPEEFMGTMDPGALGVGQYGSGMGNPMPPPGMGMPDPLMGMYREQSDMTGLATITLDNKDIVEAFRDKLRGYRIKKTYDVSTGKEVETKESFGSPFATEDGINDIVGDLAMYTSRAFTLTNIPKSDKRIINKMLYNLAIDTALKWTMNSERWHIDRTKRSAIMDLFMSIVHASMMRGYDDGERMKLYGTQKNITTTQIMPHMNPEQKKSLFGW